MNMVIIGELFVSFLCVNLFNVVCVMLCFGCIGLCSIGCDVLIVCYVKLQLCYLLLMGMCIYYIDEGVVNFEGMLLLIYGFGVLLYMWDGVLLQFMWCYCVIWFDLLLFGIIGLLCDV